MEENEIRNQVAREIWSTEIEYVKCLIILLEGYYSPLKKLKILKTKDVDAIFSNLLPIIEFHKKLLQEFRVRFENWSTQPLLGDIFIELSPFLKVYSSYFNGYENAIGIIREAKKNNARFAELIKNCFFKFNNSDICDFLIMPIQRLPRYELLLAELIKHTPSSHPDYNNLKEALNKIKQVTTLLDSKAQESINKSRFLDLLDVNKKDLKNILEPMRQWVYTGILNESLTKDGKTIKPFKCLLFSDLILLTFERKKKGIIRLETTWINNFPKYRNGFQIIGPNDTHLMIAASDQDKQTWIKLITECIEKLKEQEKVAKERSTYHIYPDYQVPGLLRAGKFNASQIQSQQSMESLNSNSSFIRGRKDSIVEIDLPKFQPPNPENEEDFLPVLYSIEKGWQIVEETDRSAPSKPTEKKPSPVDWRRTIQQEFVDFDLFKQMLATQSEEQEGEETSSEEEDTILVGPGSSMPMKDRIAEIQHNLDVNLDLLSDPLRILLKEGHMVLKGHSKIRYLFLFNDMFLITKARGRGQLKLEKKFDLSDPEVRIYNLADGQENENDFELDFKKKKYVFHTNSLEEKSSWLKEIKNAKKPFQLRNPSNSLRSGTTSPRSGSPITRKNTLQKNAPNPIPIPIPINSPPEKSIDSSSPTNGANNFLNFKQNNDINGTSSNAVHITNIPFSSSSQSSSPISESGPELVEVKLHQYKNRVRVGSNETIST